MTQTNVPKWMQSQISFQYGAEAKTTEQLRVTDLIVYIAKGDAQTSLAGATVSSAQRKMREQIAECYGKGMDADAVKKVIDPTKKRFPAVTWSGTFPNGRKAHLVETHSQILCQDIDLKPTTNDQIPQIQDRQAKLRELLAKDQHVAGMFTSPSGYGLKPLFLLTGLESWVPEGANDDQRVEAINLFHAAAFLKVRNYLYQSYGSIIFDGEVDEACKDVSRLCFLPHDENAIFCLEPVPFDISWSTELEEQVAHLGTAKKPATNSTSPEGYSARQRSASTPNPYGEESRIDSALAVLHPDEPPGDHTVYDFWLKIGPQHLECGTRPGEMARLVIPIKTLRRAGN